jgi:hypothetical protein
MKVCGGLGNQLFQYAAGLALARRHQARLIIDTSFYRTKSRRSFQLNQLDLDFELWLSDETSGRELSSTRPAQPNLTSRPYDECLSGPERELRRSPRRGTIKRWIRLLSLPVWSTAQLDVRRSCLDGFGP